MIYIIYFLIYKKYIYVIFVVVTDLLFLNKIFFFTKMIIKSFVSLKYLSSNFIANITCGLTVTLQAILEIHFRLESL